MRQVLLREPHLIEEIEVPIPDKKSGWLLAKTLRTGICGSDVQSYYGETIVGKKFPFHIGHEICAVVEEIDSSNCRLKKGDIIVIDPIFSCGYCDPCYNFNTNNCEYGTTIGSHGIGGFSEYVFVPETSAFKVNNHEYESMIFAEPLSTVIHGFNKLKIGTESKVLIQGMGNIGLLFFNIAKLANISEIVVTDVNNKKLEIAAKVGATKLLNPTRENDKFILDQMKFDIIIDCSGSVNSMQSCMDKIEFGGQILLFGLCLAHETIRINPFDLYKKNATVMGSHKSTKNNFLEAISLLERRVLINTSLMIDSVQPLSELESSIIRINAGKSYGKIIINTTEY